MLPNYKKTERVVVCERCGGTKIGINESDIYVCFDCGEVWVEKPVNLGLDRQKLPPRGQQDPK